LLGRIEWQQRLETHHLIQNKKAADAKQQHADRVGKPTLFPFLIDTRCPVETQFDRSQDRCQKSTFPVEHTRHVAAEHGRDCDDDHAIEKDLGPADEGHGRLPFRSALA
jgi:hypothetical protein